MNEWEKKFRKPIMSTVPLLRLSGLYFAYFSFVGAFSPYFSLYLQSLGRTAAEIGVLLSLMQFMRIFAPNLWGAMADARGRRAALLQLALAAATLSWCGVFFTDGFWGLFAVLALVSFFTGAALPLAEVVTFSHLREDPGRYGPVRVWGSIGFIVAVLGVGAALDLHPIGMLPWFVLACLAAALACSGLIRDTAGEARHGAERPVWPLLARPEVAVLFAACFLMCAAHGPLYTFYSIYLAEHGYSKSAIGALWSAGVAAEIVVFMVMPALFRRFSPHAVLVASFGCAAARFVMIGWGVESIAVLLLAQLLHAATFAAYHAAAIGIVNDMFRDGQRARGQALYTSLSFGAGGMLGAMASGVAWEALGPAWTFTLGSGCAFLGLILLLWRGKMSPAVSATA